MLLPTSSTSDNSNDSMPLTVESYGGGSFKIAPGEGRERVISALDPNVERTSSAAGITTYSSSDGDRASSVANGFDKQTKRRKGREERIGWKGFSDGLVKRQHSD
ncbi:hypothetical protein QR685DRAFT_549445 [Neurospora intermedia]|uniref:Uncharacterized protein n=1 Tax=Neurospora intermedia TaxID=5142 RepID=A0ABR3DPW9_NEUIN